MAKTATDTKKRSTAPRKRAAASDGTSALAPAAAAAGASGQRLDRDLQRRVIVEGVHPEVDAGRFPIKRTVGEPVLVSADIFTDGHDTLAAALLYRRAGEDAWREVPMVAIGNDRWGASFTIDKLRPYSVHGRGLGRSLRKLAARAVQESRRGPGRQERAPRGRRARARHGGQAR